jgi:hypothetical protein
MRTYYEVQLCILLSSSLSHVIDLIDCRRNEYGGNGIVLSTENKEHHSSYSKDDIWVISDSSDMRNPKFYMSMYYGASGSSFELNPFTPGDTLNQTTNQKFYAIRAYCASSDIMMLDALNSRLTDTPIVKHLLNGSTNSREVSLVFPELESDFFKVVESMILEYKLNTDQAAVIRAHCRSICGKETPIVLAHGMSSSFIDRRVWCWKVVPNCCISLNFGKSFQAEYVSKYHQNCVC